MIKEIWKDIVGYEGFYQVSNLGRVKSLDRTFERKDGKPYFQKGCIIKLKANIHGYKQVNLYRIGKRKTITIHRLVATTFINNEYGKPEINHKNGIKTDNMVYNLEWVTRKENVVHAHNNDLAHIRKGEDVNFSKLNKKQIYEIRELYDNRLKNNTSVKEIANMYNITKGYVYMIGKRYYWKHL